MSETVIDVQYSEEHFDKIMDDAVKEEVSEKTKKATEKILSKAPKGLLDTLLNADGADFYKKLLVTMGTVRFQNPLDQGIKEAIEDVKAGTGLDDEEAVKILKENKAEALKGMSTIKIITAKILGFLKVCWDTGVITLGLTTRVSSNLLVNLGRAVWDTCKFAKEESKHAGSAIKDSWNRNMN
ncbi:MAG: hypothetical protein ACRDBY_08650 [Cetobacterium sp.]